MTFGSGSKRYEAEEGCSARYVGDDGPQDS
jgi:hypothetical protein